MTYTYLLEVASVFILGMILYDYRNKMRVARRDGKLFYVVLISGLMTSVIDLVSALLIKYGDIVPRWTNITVATLYFVLQATTIFGLVLFSFHYMNNNIHVHSYAALVMILLYGINLFISLVTPWTKWYFYFDAQGHYIQGSLADLGYYFFFINVFACVIYAIWNREHLQAKDLHVAAVVAVLVSCSVLFQFIFRNILTIGFGIALIVLYLYVTLENPNDYQDKLTLCLNNYGFKVLINEKCNRGKAFTVIELDIKKFRYINAIYSEHDGSLLLQKIANYLEAEFKEELVARAGDDIFTIVTTGTEEQVHQAITKIDQRFRQGWELPNGEIVYLEVVLISCRYPEHFVSHTELLKLSDLMLARVKETPDSNVLYSTDEIAVEYRRQEAVERSLRLALKQHTLQVVYQPIYDSKKGCITAVEALSRLNDSRLGSIPPDEFIKVAESTGLIIELGFYVLKEACQFIRKHLIDNPRNTISSVHINMSMLQCAFPDSIPDYIDMIHQYDIPCEMIHFELTESTVIGSPELVKDAMTRLMESEIRFSLDDYGTGFSNISYLLQFPFGMVKFDKNMVWSYFKNNVAKTIMENEFHIFHVIDKDIVVEGIETEEQYKLLRDCNIHLFQGYYFARPLPQEECMEAVYHWAQHKDENQQIRKSMAESIRAELVVSKLLETDYDSIATIDIQTQVAYPFSISKSELGMTKVLDMQEHTDNISGGLEDFFRQYCLPQDVERVIHENTMEVVLEALNHTDTYESIYSVDFGNGVERKRAMYSYLDTNHEYLICAVQNITDMYNREKQLRQKAETDMSTTLYNKKTAELKIEQQFQQSQKGSLFIIDIDDLKFVNDNYGHSYGDIVIRKLAQTLKTVFDDRAILGRIGGDEFVAYLENTDPTYIEEKAREICTAYQMEIPLEDEILYTSASVGVAIRKNETSLKQLFQRADQALYTIKKAEKNSYCIAP